MSVLKFENNEKRRKKRNCHNKELLFYYRDQTCSCLNEFDLNIAKYACIGLPAVCVQINMVVELCGTFVLLLKIGIDLDNQRCIA